MRYDIRSLHFKNISMERKPHRREICLPCWKFTLSFILILLLPLLGCSNGKSIGDILGTDNDNRNSKRTNNDNGNGEETGNENGNGEETGNENGNGEETGNENGNGEETGNENGNGEETGNDPQVERCLVTSCTFEVLPMLGQLYERPTLDQVVGRIVVSHSWMRKRFIEAFEAMPQALQEDLLLLFRPVTLMQIDSDVRPAYYTSSRNSIHIDPAYIWLTKEEKKVIDPKPDYRTNFGAELQFITSHRIVIDNEYAFERYSLTDDSERDLKEIIISFSRLLLHELAHANDYVPPEILDQAERETTPSRFNSQHSSERISSQLSDMTPLQSDEMREYARVRYHGAKASEELIGYDGAGLGEYFEPDGGNHPYNYASIREDVAMLFETVLTKFHFNADWDIAFIQRPSQEESLCDDQIVSWGFRGRIGEPQIKERALFVVGKILPERDLAAFIENIPPALPLAVGCGWCDNLDRTCGTPAPRQVDGLPRSLRREGRLMPWADIRPPFGRPPE